MQGHELGAIRTSRGDRGKRTVFYAYCECGYGIPSSVNPASVEAKHAKHVSKLRRQSRIGVNRLRSATTREAS